VISPDLTICSNNTRRVVRQTTQQHIHGRRSLPFHVQ
jgi:hypothetical protein